MVAKVVMLAWYDPPLYQVLLLPQPQPPLAIGKEAHTELEQIECIVGEERKRQRSRPTTMSPRLPMLQTHAQKGFHANCWGVRNGREFRKYGRFVQSRLYAKIGDKPCKYR